MLGIFAVVESLPPDAVVSQIESDPNLLREYDLRTSAVKVLLVMREDYLPAVQARFPRVLRSSMRLAPLGVEQALKVIMRVSSDHVRPEAARRIVETLAVENRSGLPDREVDPPMLSLWMRELEEARRNLGREYIDQELVEAYQLSNLMAGFLARTLSKLPPKVERFLLATFVTPGGKRESCSLERAEAELQTHGLSPDILQTLVDRRIIGLASSRNMTTVQLTHDLLVPPLMKRRTTGSRARKAWSFWTRR